MVGTGGSGRAGSMILPRTIKIREVCFLSPSFSYNWSARSNTPEYIENRNKKFHSNMSEEDCPFEQHYMFDPNVQKIFSAVYLVIALFGIFGNILMIISTLK